MFKPIEQANEIILQLLLDNCTNTFEYVWKNFGVEYARTITWFWLIIIVYASESLGRAMSYLYWAFWFQTPVCCFKAQTGVCFFCLYFLTLRKYLFLNFFQIYECVEKSKNHAVWNNRFSALIWVTAFFRRTSIASLEGCTVREWATNIA